MVTMRAMLLIYISLCPFHGVPLYCTMRSAQHTVLSIVFCMRSQYRKARPKSVPAGHVRGDSVPGWPTGVRVAPLASTRGAPAGRPGQPARAAGLTRAVAATRPSPPPVPPPPPPRRPAAQPASTVTFAAAATAAAAAAATAHTKVIHFFIMEMYIDNHGVLPDGLLHR